MLELSDTAHCATLEELRTMSRTEFAEFAAPLLPRLPRLVERLEQLALASDKSTEANTGQADAESQDKN